MNENIASLIWQTSATHGEKTFLSGPESQYTYRDAKGVIQHYANAFRTLNVNKNDRVIILSKNRPEVALSIFAAHALGAIPIILHESSTHLTLKQIAQEVSPSAVILDEHCADKGDCFSAPCVLLADFHTMGAGHTEPLTPIDIEKGHIALIIYTSGSTGRPRGVCLTHQNVLFVIERIQRRLGYQTDDTVGMFLPLSFDYGLYQLFLCAKVGARLFIRDSAFAGPMLLKCLNEDQITVLPGVPNMLASLLKIALRRETSLPHMRQVSNTGAHLPESYQAELKKVMPNVEVYPMYGLTECKRVSILTPQESHLCKPNSVGRPLDDTEAWVVDESGQRLAPGEVGELVIRGSHVGVGYWQAPRETMERFRKDPETGEMHLYTGDRFTIDEQGYLYYVGRMDDQFKRHGFRINKLEIEQAALSIPCVLSAAVLVSNEKLKLFVTVSDSEVKDQALLKALAEILEPYKVPDDIYVLEELPRSRNGKVDKNALEAFA